MPNMNGAFCTANTYNYNAVCASDAQTRTTLTGVGLAAGISLGALLGALAYWSGPDVLSRDETAALISQHNGALLKRLRSETTELHVSPQASSQGAGVVATLTF